MQRRKKIFPALAAALCLSGLAAAQTAQNQTAAPSAPPSDAQARQAAKAQLRADQKTLKDDMRAAQAACQTPSPACDAANAQVKADREKMKADQQALKSVFERTKGVRQDPGTIQSRSPKAPPAETNTK